uniref:SHR-BD domain-containing protein n=1 Tax=Macrostomum lignano TaxID=282301 RepID=A0A1I8GZ21_9PLAT
RVMKSIVETPNDANGEGTSDGFRITLVWSIQVRYEAALVPPGSDINYSAVAPISGIVISVKCGKSSNVPFRHERATHWTWASTGEARVFTASLADPCVMVSQARALPFSTSAKRS